MRLTQLTRSFWPAFLVVLMFSFSACSEGSPEAVEADKAPETTGVKSEPVPDACDCFKTKELSQGQKKFCRESKRDTQFLELLRQCRISEVGGVSAVNNFPDDGQYTMDTDQSMMEWLGSKVGMTEKGSVPIRRCAFSIEESRLVSGEMVVEMTGIQSTSQEGVASRELGKHLRSADFFHVTEFPEAAYTVTSARADGRGNLVLKGKLNIKGRIKETEALMSFASADPLVASITMGFNRADFDVRFGSGTFFEDLGDDLISDQVQIRMALIENVSKRKLPG